MEKYIDKDALVAEIEKLIKSYSPIQSSEGKYKVEAYKEVLDTVLKVYLKQQEVLYGKVKL